MWSLASALDDGHVSNESSDGPDSYLDRCYSPNNNGVHTATTHHTHDHTHTAHDQLLLGPNRHRLVPSQVHRLVPSQVH
jgi:hypothetical protein